MSNAVWRYTLTLGALLALVIAVGDAFDRNRIGDIGITVTPVAETRAVVTGVAPGSDPARAGVRVGHYIDAEEWLRPQGTLLSGRANGIRAGESATFYDESLRRSVVARAIPLAATFSVSRIVAHLIRLLSLLFALVLFWHFADDRAARTLGGFLLFYNLQGFLNSGSFLMPLWFSPLVGLQSQALMWLMLALFACWFPDRRPADGRRRIAIAATCVTFVIIVAQLLSFAAAYGLKVPHLAPAVFNALLIYAVPLVFALFIILAVRLDFRTASPLDRRRLEWCAVGMALEAYSFVSIAAFGSSVFSFGGAFNTVSLTLNDVGTVAGTICLLYGFLRYRVLDLSFAVNRAAVFALLSGAIVAIFVLVEYVVSKYVESSSHITGAAITLGVALAIGVFLRALHRQVDRFADRVIFRARHLADESLRTFGRSAPFINDEAVLRERTLSALTQYARVDFASLYVRAADGFQLAASSAIGSVEVVPDHDPAIVALRERRGPVFPDSASSQLAAEIVFPLFVRGELTGCVACGARRNHESFTPEDLETIGNALGQVGTQIDALQLVRLKQKLQQVEELVRVQRLLGADPALVLQRIAEVSSADKPLVQEVPVR